jgi:RNA polymerase sigma factor (sigma-70 family)
MDNGASSYYRYLAGDDSALGDIVRDYKDGLTIYLNSFTNNIHDAEELMEETFFRIAYKKPKFSGKSSFKTWLYSIGRNIAIDYLRRMKKKKNDTSLDDCHSMQSDDLANVIRSKGATAVIGFSNSVSFLYRDELFFEILINSMLFSADSLKGGITEAEQRLDTAIQASGRIQNRITDIETKYR